MHKEPFRLFFPFATLAGLLGVMLWPLMLLGWTSNDYPGPSHTRLMVQGFFGGFIFGFLGTALPRMLGVRPLAAREAFGALALFIANVAANALSMNMLGDALFAAELALWPAMLLTRLPARSDLPPPSFVLVALAFLCGMGGTMLHIAGPWAELNDEWQFLARLLGFHAFPLFCVLGAGGFLLPRFLGLGVRRNFPETRQATPEWRRACLVALAAGGALLVSYGLEAIGRSGLAGGLRALTFTAYLLFEVPLERWRWRGQWRGVQWQLSLAIFSVPVGVLLAGCYPGMRATLLHLELVAGFALLTTSVATRVVFGHSGARERLERFHPGLTAAGAFMLLGLATRMSGDFLPGIQATHYLYGALCWLLGALIWAVWVLPRVLRPDPETDE